MAGIVCAIRGGPSSQPTIEKAIEIALDAGLSVYFLYVVNLDFLSRSASSRIHVIQEELENLGDFILLSAKGQADAQGVAAQGIVRHGSVTQEIISLCQKIDADYVVLGRPQRQREGNVFDELRLKEFISRLEQQSGAQVVFPERGMD